MCVYVFDLLYFNGKFLVKELFRKRREFLYFLFKEVDGEFVFVKFMILLNIDEIVEFFDEFVKGNKKNYVLILIEY